MQWTGEVLNSEELQTPPCTVAQKTTLLCVPTRECMFRVLLCRACAWEAEGLGSAPRCFINCVFAAVQSKNTCRLCRGSAHPPLENFPLEKVQSVAVQ